MGTFRRKYREAAHQLLVKASADANPDKKRRGRGKAARRDVDFVCVHIRRKDHLEFEAMNKMPHLSRSYFIQAMDYFAEQLQRPVFVIVTDDPVWAEGQIPPGFLPVFTTSQLKTRQDWTWLFLQAAITQSCQGELLACGEISYLVLPDFCPSIFCQPLWSDLLISNIRFH